MVIYYMYFCQYSFLHRLGGLHAYVLVFFFCKQKTADEMRISDWSSDVCSSDLIRADRQDALQGGTAADRQKARQDAREARQETRQGNREDRRDTVKGDSDARKEDRKRVG